MSILWQILACFGFIVLWLLGVYFTIKFFEILIGGEDEDN